MICMPFVFVPLRIAKVLLTYNWAWHIIILQKTDFKICARFFISERSQCQPWCVVQHTDSHINKEKSYVLNIDKCQKFKFTTFLFHLNVSHRFIVLNNIFKILFGLCSLKFKNLKIDLHDFFVCTVTFSKVLLISNSAWDIIIQQRTDSKFVHDIFSKDLYAKLKVQFSAHKHTHT